MVGTQTAVIEADYPFLQTSGSWFPGFRDQVSRSSLSIRRVRAHLLTPRGLLAHCFTA